CQPPSPSQVQPPPWATCRTPRTHGRPSEGGAPCSHPCGRGRSFPTASSALLKEIDELAVAGGDARNRLLTRRLVALPVDKRLPEHSASDGKADEARHLPGDPQPLSHLLIVLAAAEHDAADMVAPAGPGCRHHRLAILTAVEAFDLPE